jgi:hypothetical protein
VLSGRAQCVHRADRHLVVRGEYRAKGCAARKQLADRRVAALLRKVARDMQRRVGSQAMRRQRLAITALAPMRVLVAGQPGDKSDPSVAQGDQMLDHLSCAISMKWG